MSDLKVGDKLYAVYNDRRRGDPVFVTITKIGRKWLHTERFGKIDKETLTVDGGDYSSPAQAYRTKDEYEAAAAISSAWGALKSDMGRTYRMPEGLTLERIKAASALIFGKTQEGGEPVDNGESEGNS